MAVFNEPQKWGQTLGQNADVVLIPDTSGETDPSIDKLFPSVFSIPLAQGGRAIPRSVLNGLFKLLGDWVYYIQNGGIASYSASFDYAVGAFVKYNDEFYRCIQINGASTGVKTPTETAYWSKVTTLADVADAFANQDLSNLTANGQAIIDNKADISLSNVNNTANILMAHNAMPSDSYDSLTIGTSGTSYTMPADGWISVVGRNSATTNGYIFLNSPNLIGTICHFTNADGYVFLPVRKGTAIIINYSSNVTVLRVTFVYAVGSESEKV